MPLSRIKQTSKMLLIEEFCTSDSVPSLYTLLRTENVKEKSVFYKAIEDKLEVRSYKEFIDKFMPSVWEWTEKSDDISCPVHFCYSLEKPNGILQAHEVKLSNNEFYNMVMDLYSKKGISGESNLEFDYSKVAELLSPKKVMENAKQLRKDLQYNYNKMLELGEGAKVEKAECIKRIRDIRKEIVSQYKDSFTGKIKLALADVENKLALLPELGKSDDRKETDVFRLPCKASFDENGNIQVLVIEDHQSVMDNEDKTSTDNQLALLIGQDFDKYGGENNSYMKELVISNYCGSSKEKLDREELLQKRNQYMTIYKASQEQFIRAISSAVEKILNVKVFFEQASIQDRKLPAPIIVTNCKVNRLVENETVKKDFEYFIRETEKEIDDYRIWFAIIPAIGDIDFVDKPEIEVAMDLFEDLEYDNEKNDSIIRTQDGDVLVSTDTLKDVLEILKEGKITTFFNYRANERTGFGKLDNDLLEKYRRKLDSINGNAYAVFCYPNFTVLPKKETAIEIGKREECGQETKVFMDIPGIYVDASYVAAGLVVASQNPEYLEKKGYKVKKNNPGVRFDLEDGDNRFIMLTKMNREGKGTWASEVEENIGADKFGFCFCGNTKFYKNEKVKNTYIYVARNMNKDKFGNYNPIYTRLTMDFVMQYLQTTNLSIGGRNKFKPSVINEFIEKIGEWKREAESESKLKANSILRNNEDIIFEDNVLKIKFRNTEAEVALDIEKSE